MRPLPATVARARGCGIASGVEIAWTMLAVAGFCAVAWRLARSAFGLLRHVADVFWTDELSWTRARTGDLTGMQEADQEARTARRARWKDTGVVLLWTGALALPALLPWTREAYVVANLVWLLPRKGLRRE